MTNLTLVERFYSAVSQGDSETIRRSLSPDIEWVQTEGFPNGKTYQGIDAVFKELFCMFSQEWHQWRSDVHEYCDAGDKIIVLGYYNGIYKRTNKEMRASFAHILTLKSAKIVKFLQYTDTIKIVEAMHGEAKKGD